MAVDFWCAMAASRPALAREVKVLGLFADEWKRRQTAKVARVVLGFFEAVHRWSKWIKKAVHLLVILEGLTDKRKLKIQARKLMRAMTAEECPEEAAFVQRLVQVLLAKKSIILYICKYLAGHENALLVGRRRAACRDLEGGGVVPWPRIPFDHPLAGCRHAPHRSLTFPLPGCPPLRFSLLQYVHSGGEGETEMTAWVKEGKAHCGLTSDFDSGGMMLTGGASKDPRASVLVGVLPNSSEKKKGYRFKASPGDDYVYLMVRTIH